MNLPEISLLVALAVTPAFSQSKQVPFSQLSFKQMAKRVESIRPNPLISKRQADEMYSMYYSLHIHQCCLPTIFEDKGDHWSWFPPSDDDCNPDTEPVKIDKATGRITWRRGPTYENPRALGKAGLTLGSTRTPPASRPALSHRPASSASLSASAQAVPVSLIR